jgi:hypothetical protein
MMRKSLIAATAAASLALGAIAAPAMAIVPSLQPVPAVEGNELKQDVSHWVRKCRFVRIKTYYGWKKVKRCKRVYLEHNSY